MTFTWGANTGDDVTANAVPNNVTGDNLVGLVVGTFYPTTLTATRAYWGVGNSGFRATVDATTSEIRMISLNATTNGQWLTSGAGIAIDQWWFIAWMFALENTTVAGAWRVWVGNETTPPTEISVSNPTPRSGNYTGAGNIAAGNAGNGGNVSWQGDIGWLSLMGCTTTLGVNDLLPIATSGVITDDEANAVKDRWVIPFYQGRPRLTDGNCIGQIVHLPLQPGAGINYIWANSAAGSFSEGVSNGVTRSERLPFVVPPQNWPIIHPYVRR